MPAVGAAEVGCVDGFCAGVLRGSRTTGVVGAADVGFAPAGVLGTEVGGATDKLGRVVSGVGA
ncbi:MAG: hypothetical protein K2W85_08670, partial [Phycisphaerales bacterium]|nr:hypothetical protein [Phycisphaerales bacterium]